VEEIDLWPGRGEEEMDSSSEVSRLQSSSFFDFLEVNLSSPGGSLNAGSAIVCASWHTFPQAAQLSRAAARISQFITSQAGTAAIGKAIICLRSSKSSC